MISAFLAYGKQKTYSVYAFFVRHVFSRHLLFFFFLDVRYEWLETKVGYGNAKRV
jgi:hypothetical protein